jgi:hypothetical protein
VSNFETLLKIVTMLAVVSALLAVVVAITNVPMQLASELVHHFLEAFKACVYTLLGLLGGRAASRDHPTARPDDDATARKGLLNSGLPTVGRRLLAIVAYAAAVCVLAFFVLLGLKETGLISGQCVLDPDLCSVREDAMFWGVALGAIGILVLCIVQGLRGRLYGCRVRRKRIA